MHSLKYVTTAKHAQLKMQEDTMRGALLPRLPQCDHLGSGYLSVRRPTEQWNEWMPPETKQMRAHMTPEAGI